MKFKQLQIGDIFSFKGSPTLKYIKLSDKTIQYINGKREIRMTEIDRKTEVIKHDE